MILDCLSGLSLIIHELLKVENLSQPTSEMRQKGVQRDSKCAMEAGYESRNVGGLRS